MCQKPDRRGRLHLDCVALLPVGLLTRDARILLTLVMIPDRSIFAKRIPTVETEAIAKHGGYL